MSLVALLSEIEGTTVVARAVETNDPRVSKEIVKAFTIVYDSSICDC